MAARLALADGAGGCLRGGLVAYDPAVKRQLLRVQPGPVVSQRAVEQMARGSTNLLDGDVGLATSGVVGPAREDDQPVGTLWLAVATPARVHVRGGRLVAGAPEEVRDRAVVAALGLLVAVLEDESRT